MKVKRIRRWIICAMLPALCGWSGIVFQDTFENGSVADSDNETGFWSTTYASGSGSYVEANGTLSIIADRPAGASSSTYNTMASVVNSQLDFFSSPLTVSADITMGGTVAASDIETRFFIASSEQSAYSSMNDVFGLYLKGNNQMRIESKNNGASNYLVRWQTLPATPVGFEITLDAENFNVTVYLEGGGSAEFSGTHGMTANDWDTVGSSLAVQVFRLGSYNDGEYSELVLDNLTAALEGSATLSLVILSEAETSLRDVFNWTDFAWPDEA